MPSDSLLTIAVCGSLLRYGRIVDKPAGFGGNSNEFLCGSTRRSHCKRRALVGLLTQQAMHANELLLVDHSQKNIMAVGIDVAVGFKVRDAGGLSPERLEEWLLPLGDRARVPVTRDKVQPVSNVTVARNDTSAGKKKGAKKQTKGAPTWIAHHAKIADRPFYINTRTFDRVWTPPEGFICPKVVSESTKQVACKAPWVPLSAPTRTPVPSPRRSDTNSSKDDAQYETLWATRNSTAPGRGTSNSTSKAAQGGILPPPPPGGLPSPPPPPPPSTMTPL